MIKKIKLTIAAAITVLSGCSGNPHRALAPAELELGTGGSITMHYHSALYYPEEISLLNGGYLVGIEKGSPGDILQPGDNVLFKQSEPRDNSLQKMQRMVSESKIMFVSHILYDQPPKSQKSNCSIYDAYYRSDSEHQFVEPCLGSTEPRRPVPAKDAYRASWEAMEAMQTSMGNQIKGQPYTHILVVTMGWNTVQEEAVRNINSIVRGIKNASKDNQGNPTFNPLLVGVTWPSQWNSSWVEPLVRLISFPIKAQDADEVGLTWLGVLLEKTIPQAKQAAGKNLPVVVIGHSFGARAASTAACVGSVISDGDPSTNDTKQPVDLLINYQGAFLVSRLLGDSSDRGFSLGQGCPHVKTLALTSSIHDEAMDTAFWGNYAGNDTSFNKYCEHTNSRIGCAKADQKGNISQTSKNGQKIIYINSDDLIKQNAFNTGGGAHSDIYRDEQGALSWSLIKDLESEHYKPMAAMEN